MDNVDKYSVSQYSVKCESFLIFPRGMTKREDAAAHDLSQPGIKLPRDAETVSTLKKETMNSL